eukprot:m.331383 g.331383  ORF g.331383 m.331383 type:complete len:56 (-) comp16714_c0_seq1:779-946(-)
MASSITNAGTASQFTLTKERVTANTAQNGVFKRNIRWWCSWRDDWNSNVVPGPEL